MTTRAFITSSLPVEVSPTERLRGVPLVGWAVNTLRRVFPLDRIALSVADDGAARFGEAHGLAIGDAPRGESGFVWDLARPFCSARTLRAAMASGAPTGSGIEGITIRSRADLELSQAVANGLAPDHPCVVGVNRMRLPLSVDVEAIVSDVDGVLTNGTIVLHSDGELARAFHMQDGIATRRLINAGFEIGWLSASVNDGTIQKRADRLGVRHVDVGEGDKGDRFIRLCARMKVDPARTLYIGDDLNDLPAMELAGLSACPADARPTVRATVDLVLDAPGGRAAHAEVADLLLDEAALKNIQAPISPLAGARTSASAKDAAS